MRDALLCRGLYASSREQLTPGLRDPPSLLPAAFVATSLLLSPRKTANIARQAVSNYSITPAAVAEVARAAVDHA